MRVLFLSVAGRLGGAERVLMDTFTALRLVAPHIEPLLLTAEDGPVVQAARDRGVAADVLPLPDVIARLGESGSSALGLLASATRACVPLRRYRRRLAAHIATRRPALVHSNGLKMHLLSASLGARVPVLWHMHDYASARRVSACLLRWAAPRAAGAIAPSESVAADTHEVLGPAFSVTTAHNPVDLGRFTPDGPVLDLDVCAGLPAAPRSTVRIGLVATYARWKGHEVFLRGLAALGHATPWRAYIVGGPVYQTRGSQVTQDELRDRARTLGILERVGFVGFLPDTSPALRALDVVVHASTSPEPFGLTVAEGMAAGRAVAVSASGGVTELFTDGRDALGFGAGDAHGLAAVLARLAGDPALRCRLGANARATAEERFGMARFGTTLVSAYERATTGAAAGRVAPC